MSWVIKSVVSVGVFVCMSSAAWGQLRVTVTPNKEAYAPGDLMVFTVALHNEGEFDTGLTFGSTGRATYSLDDGAYVRPMWGLTVMNGLRVPARGSYTWTFRHVWQEHELSIGAHSVLGRIRQYDALPSEAASFTVVERALPAESFVMTFEPDAGS